MYAKVIVDISHEKLDKGFDYRIPAHLENEIYPGVLVNIPFGKGNRIIQGYVTSLSETAGYMADKIKEIDSVVKNSIPIEGRLISLAWFIKENYGSSMNQALKTVIPIKETKKSVYTKRVILVDDTDAVNDAIEKYERKHATARLKLLYALKESKEMDWSLVGKLGVSLSVAKALESEG